jgi:hypothetical protein
MKTIREICELKKIEHIRCGGDVVAWIIAALEARERERDEAERERVKAIIREYCPVQYRDDVAEAIYPPPEPAELPAGYYWYRESDMQGWLGASWIADFVPRKNVEYRSWNDPPPEVTGKAEPLQRDPDLCGDVAGTIGPPLPTFEEWCAANGFDVSRWYSSPGATLIALKAALVKKGMVRA